MLKELNSISADEDHKTTSALSIIFYFIYDLCTCTIQILYIKTQFPKQILQVGGMLAYTDRGKTDKVSTSDVKYVNS